MGKAHGSSQWQNKNQCLEEKSYSSQITIININFNDNDHGELRLQYLYYFLQS